MCSSEQLAFRVASAYVPDQPRETEAYGAASQWLSDDSDLPSHEVGVANVSGLESGAMHGDIDDLALDRRRIGIVGKSPFAKPTCILAEGASTFLRRSYDGVRP